MKVFSAGTAVTLSVPLQDKSGNPLVVSAIEYRVTDENNVELVAAMPLADFVPSSDTAAITVAAAENTLGVGVARGMRNVVLKCTVEGNQVYLHASYAVDSGDPLVVGVNSFMTYAQAEFTALSIPNLEGWVATDEVGRQAALMDARSHIVQLSFATDTVSAGQDNLNYSFDGIQAGLGFSGNLDLLTPGEYATLSPRFVEALKKAQLVEADAILGGNGVEQKRREGLIQDNIGESRQMFRQSKPLELPVCRRALGYLSLFITFSKKIGRG